MSQPCVVTIMAAGEGKRMNSDVPKVLHLFNGVPMLVRIILQANKLSPSKIIVVTGKHNFLIQLSIQTYFNENNIVMNNIYYVQQKEPNGTAGAISCCLDLYEFDIESNLNENVLILNGDMPLVQFELLDIFVKQCLEIKHGANFLVCDLENPHGYGRILTADGCVVGIREEKDCSEEERKLTTVNVGIYLFSASILKTYIPLIKNDNVQHEYYLTDLAKLLVGKIKSVTIPSSMVYQIHGVNTREELYALEQSHKNEYIYLK